MSAVITKIEVSSAGNFIYKDTDDNIIFVGSSSVNIRPISQDRVLLYDITREGVNVPYSSFEGVIVGGSLIPFTGNFQDFIVLLESVAKPIGSGSSGAVGSIVALDFDNSFISVVGSTFINFLPQLSMEFEAGDYEVYYSTKVDTSVNMTVDRRVLLDGDDINPFMFSSGFTSASRFPIQVESAPLTLTAGLHTLDFQFRGTGVANTVTNSQRYYKITKIG